MIQLREVVVLCYTSVADSQKGGLDIVPSEKVNIAIVGLGYWGPNLVRNFSEVENCRVVMMCDSRRERLERIGRRYPSAEITANYDDIVNNPTIDAVALATPVSTHHELAKRALQSGKHVLVEKPLVASVKEAEDLIETAESSRKLLMVGHTFLYTGSVRKMKELISSGELGDLHYFDSVRINLGLFRPDVNVIWDLGPHDFSIACHLIGEEPLSVSASARRIGETNLECMAYVNLTFRTGIIAHIHLSWVSPVKVRRIIVGGSRKMIIYDDVEPSEKIKVYDRGVEFDPTSETPLEPVYRLGDVLVPKLGQKEALFVEAEHFIDCIINDIKPLTDAASGLTIVKILEGCDTSLSQGGNEVVLNSD